MPQVCQRPFFVQPLANFLQRYPAIKQAAHTLALSYAHNEQVTDERLKAIGSELEVLEELAGQLDMNGGLAAWESLAQQMEKTG